MWQCATDIGVKRAIYLGDMLTFYSISRWDKDPTVSKNVGDLQAEIEAFRPYHARAQALPEGCDWVEGNHEKRFTWMMQKLPGGLSDKVNIKDFLGVELLKNTRYYTDDWRLVLQPDVVIEHGHEVKYSLKGKYAAESILAHYAEQTTIIGHTHRIYTAIKTVRGRGVPALRRVFSCGHLCDEEKENYAHDPDWQQGFMILTTYYDQSGQLAYDFHQITMNKDKHGRSSFAYNGKVYK